MGNLFFVFTPLQLFVAQQIIKQENLRKNILLYTHIGNHYDFYEIYDIMCIDDLWKEKIKFEGVEKIMELNLYNPKELWQAHKKYKQLNKIAKQHKVKTIYLGEILNQTCRMSAIYFSKRKYKVVFFEEGTSHYINRPYTLKNSCTEKIKYLILDNFCFQPLFGVKFAKWHCAPNRPYDDIPIDKRFSIIPYHNKPFDVRLNVQPLFSSKLEEYIDSNIQYENERRVMLMTDPMRELMPKEYLYLYFEAIKECVEGINPDTTLYIKFHPRELDESRERILQIVQDSGMKFRVLSKEINICVEYYLQKYHFDDIYFFNAATFFYNGYAFPKTNFIKLMPVVYKKCKEVGLTNLTYMENMLKLIEPLV